nr:hypothetical protein [uncultured Flavobacterium sp.]
MGYYKRTKYDSQNGIGNITPGSSHNEVKHLKANDCKQIQAGFAKTKKGYIYIYIENKEKNGHLKFGNYIIGNSNGASEHEFCENTLITAIIFDSKGVQKKYLFIARAGSINITRSDNVIISGNFFSKLNYENNPNDY